MATVSKSHGVYASLGPNETRLLQIQHEIDSVIYGVVRTFELSERPKYKALSYCWTAEAPSFKILLNNGSIFVRPNLYRWLQQLQEGQDQDWWFIDALCINQDDLVDRSQQVSLMKDIYQSAAEVVVWLGTGLGASLVKNEKLKQVEDQVVEDVLSQLEQANVEQHLADCYWGFQDKPLRQEKEVLTLALMRAFLHQNYWNRVWILQEVGLARNITFAFRQLRVSLELLKHFMTYVTTWAPRTAEDGDDDTIIIVTKATEHMHRSERYGTPVAERVLALNSDKAAYDYELDQYQAPRSLLRVINDCSSHKCTEPIDNIFGVLGLTSSVLRVDYAMPKLELFLCCVTEGILEYDDIVCSGWLKDDDKDQFENQQYREDKGLNEVRGCAPTATHYKHVFCHNTDESQLGSWYWSDQLLFCRNIASAVSLDICHPVVVLTMRAILQTCAMLRAGKACGIKRFEERFLMLLVKDKFYGDRRKKMSAQLRMAATIKRLEASSSSHSTFRWPHAEEDRRSSTEWCLYAVKIFFDVLARREVYLKNEAKQKMEELEEIVLRLDESTATVEIDRWATIKDAINNFIDDNRQSISLLDGTAWYRLDFQAAELLSIAQAASVILASNDQELGSDSRTIDGQFGLLERRL